MGILSILALLTIMPVLVVIKLRNLKTMSAIYLPLAAYVIFNVYQRCEIDSRSEACTWGYMQYIYALLAASTVFLIISLGQWLSAKYKRESG